MSDAERKSCLANPTRSMQDRHERAITLVGIELSKHFDDFAFPAHEAGRHRGELARD